jgi:hypothetical protein
MPVPVIRAFGVLKRAAAKVSNCAAAAEWCVWHGIITSGKPLQLQTFGHCCGVTCNAQLLSFQFCSVGMP